MNTQGPRDPAETDVARPDAGEQDLRVVLREVRELMHDIRNHLNGILGLVSVLLLQSSDPASARVRPLIETQAQQLMHLIDKVPASLGGTGHQPGKYVLFEASRFVPALVDLYRPFAADHGVRLAHCVDDDLPAMHTDPKGLHRLLSNLVVNAIKHSQASQVTVFVEAAIDPPGLRLVVADDGVGIAPQAVASLQAVLSGLNNLGPAYDRSGLAICARMALGLGATLTLQSDLGEGTSVSVSLVREVIQACAAG